MKIISLILLGLACLPSYADELILSPAALADNDRLAELEKRLAVLEQASASKIEGCELTFKKLGYYLNDCPAKTVVSRVHLLDIRGPNQIECSYYQLRCWKKNAQGQLEFEDVELK